MDFKVGKFLITHDEYNYIVNTKKKVKDEFQWVPSKYFSTLGDAMNYIAQQTPKVNEDLNSTLQELEEIKALCKRVSKKEFIVRQSNEGGVMYDK